MSIKQKSPRSDKKPKKAIKAKKVASPSGATFKAIQYLPMVGLGVLAIGIVILTWELFAKGKAEGEIAYKSGRYAVANIATGMVEGNLVPPPVTVAGSLIPDVQLNVTNPDMKVPGKSIPDNKVKLRTAPNMQLVEEDDGRMLPKISSDDVAPWRYYARPYEMQDGKKAISVIVTGLGMDKDLSLAAVRLPSAMSFAITPYTKSPDSWVRSMRAQGHEAYLMLPTQQSSYPLTDPGPQALQPTITPKENMEHLNWLLGRAVGYVGFLVPQDEVFFSAQADFIDPVVEELADRGLSVVFSQAKENVTLSDIMDRHDLVHTEAHIFIRYGSDSVDIKQQLEAAEAVAEQAGHALVVIEASPVALQELEMWANSLENDGFYLLPASALAIRIFS